jgi:hypothetical protein
MKIAHEAPLSIVREVDSLTDYSYFLVHLFEESPEYLQWAKEVVASGRENILDNSIFELEEAFDADKFAKWVEVIKPTYYIVPDALEKKDQTIEQYANFMMKYPDLPGKTIGVVQGKSYPEIVECYKFMSKSCDKIAISFDYSFFEQWYPKEKTKYHKWMKGRQRLLKMLLSEGIIDTSIPHHLLGCGLASEFSNYRDYKWIDSIDTSNPVVAGIKGQRYEYQDGSWGLNDKPTQKLFTMINESVDPDTKELILFNIEKFKENTKS